MQIGDEYDAAGSAWFENAERKGSAEEIEFAHSLMKEIKELRGAVRLMHKQ